jgi:hypothetical protein
MPVSLQNDFKALETKADNQAGNERIRTICLCEDEPMFSLFGEAANRH